MRTFRGFVRASSDSKFDELITVTHLSICHQVDPRIGSKMADDLSYVRDVSFTRISLARI